MLFAGGVSTDGLELCGTGVGVVCCEISGFDTTELTDGAATDIGSLVIVTVLLLLGLLDCSDDVELITELISDVCDTEDTTDTTDELELREDVSLEELLFIPTPIIPKEKCSPPRLLCLFLLYLSLFFSFSLNC